MRDQDDKDPDELEEMQGVYYMPCRLCGSLDYDQGNPDEAKLADQNIFEPLVCDVCNFGFIKGSGIHLH